MLNIELTEKDYEGMSNSKRQYNVLILEDMSAVADRLNSSLQSWPKARILPVCPTISHALAAIRSQSVDILIADLKLPDGLGTTAIRELKSRNPEAHILVMTVLNDGPVVLDAIRAGATGYLLKDDSTFGLISAIEMVLEGRSPMSATIARLIVSSLQADAPSQPLANETEEKPNLTEREKDVLAAIAKGYSHKEVAEILGISYTTVPVHTRNIYRKLQTSNKTQAVAAAQRHGLIPR